jgi:chromosome partitioning protein
LGFLFSIGYFFGKRNTDSWNKLRKLKTELEKAEETLSKSDRELTKCRAERAGLASENRKYNAMKKSLLGNDEGLWLAHDNAPYEHYDRDMGSGDLEVMTVMNLKGGVGKTTLATNLAAHFDTALGKRVLVIDLDFQGSATTALLATTALDILPDVKVDHLFETGPSLVSKNDVQIQLAGSPLSRSSLIPSGYSFAGLENRLMVQWLLKETETDPRYLLAEYIFRQGVREAFDVVIIDAPPRLSLGAINALTASHSLIIPTIPDRTSSEAVRNFVQQANELKPSLNSHLNRAFFVCNRSSSGTLAENEAQMWDVVKGDDYAKAWNGMRHIVPTIIPRRAAFANATFNRTLAYFHPDGASPKTMDILKAFGNDIASELNNI